MKLWRALAFGFFATVIIVVLLICFKVIPAYGEICEITKEGAEKDCATYNIFFVFLWHVGKFLDRWSAAIVAAATIVVAWFTGTLWRSTKLLWLAGEKQYVAANRPRLVIRAMTLRKGDHPQFGQGNGITHVQFMMANVGGSRADLINSSILAGIVSKDNRELPPYSGDEIEVGIKCFEPGDTALVDSELRVPVPSPPITNPVFNTDFAVWGYIVYLDSMKNRRQSYFYRIWDAEAQRFKKSSDEDLEYEY